MKKILFFLASLIFVLNVFAEEQNTQQTSTSNANTNQYIDVGTPNTKKLRIAIPPFYLEKAQPSTKNTLLTITNRFKDILDFTFSWDCKILGAESFVS